MLRWPQILLLVTAVLAGLTYSNSLHNSTGGETVPAYSADALDALLASMRESELETGSKLIRLSGVTSADQWSPLLGAFRESLAGGVELQLDVFVINDDVDVGALCAGMFTNIALGSVSFGQSGTELRPGSLPSLDRLAEFARDCRQSGILITGHSDSTGIAANNERLSRARAQAVADYLITRGAAAEQLQVRGAGSQHPIADDATPQGRALNRRIEFELRESQ